MRYPHIRQPGRPSRVVQFGLAGYPTQRSVPRRRIERQVNRQRAVMDEVASDQAPAGPQDPCDFGEGGPLVDRQIDRGVGQNKKTKMVE